MKTRPAMLDFWNEISEWGNESVEIELRLRSLISSEGFL